MFEKIVLVVFIINYLGSIDTNYLDEANKAISSGNFTLAAKMYDKAIEENPRNYLPYFLKGNLEDVRRHHKSSLQNYAKAIELNPEFADARFNRASVLLKLGKISECKDELNKIIQMSNAESLKKAEAELSSVKQLENMLKKVQNSLATSRYKEVIDISDTILKSQFLNSELRKSRAEAFQNLGFPDQQISELLILQQINPHDIELILDIHHMLYSDGKLEEVVENLRKCLNLDPDHSKCREHFKKARNLQKLFSKVESLTEDKKYNDVLEICNSIAKLESSIGFYKNRINLIRCTVYFKLDDFKDAVKFCTLVLKENGNEIEALMARGNSYFALNQYDDAKSDFSQVLSINNHHEEAAQMLRNIESAGKTKRDYYNILNVSRTATKEEISRAYRHVARIWHPDRFKTEEEKKAASKKLQDINDARTVLLDDDNRRLFNSGVDPLDKEVQQNNERNYAHHQQHFGGGRSFFDFFQGNHFDFDGNNHFGNAHHGGGQRRQVFFNFG